MSKPFLMFILLGSLCLAGLTACNTIRGVGEDISALGDALSGGAKDVQRKIHED